MNETTLKRRTTSFRLPGYLLDGLRTEAQRKHKSMNSLVEVFLLDALYRQPNAETLAAIEECRSGVDLEDFNPDELDKYIYEGTEEVNTI